MSTSIENTLPKSWEHRLSQHVERKGDQVLYRFLPDGEGEGIEWTFAHLQTRARTIAATLIARGCRGERVLLVHPAGLEFAAAFMGCLLAGAVAVPTFPPRSASQARLVNRLKTVVSSATPKLVMTTSESVERVAEMVQLAGGGAASLPVIATDTLDAAAADGWRDLEIAADTLACLQYTSGSTSTPKGVMLSHGAFLSNCEQISNCFGFQRGWRGVGWLPPYHDMGLVGGILTPLYFGQEITLMPPAAFLQRPARWLQAITKYKAHVSGGPNFAFELCTDAVSDEAIAQLDLSTWEVAFTGAEPVRPATMTRFAERFAKAGFRAASFFPCYGMAETTLMVSCIEKGDGVNTAAPAAADESPTHAPPLQYTSCGVGSSSDTTIAIVDPNKLTRVVDGAVGEIWVRSPSVASGYWQQPELSAAIFDAQLADAGDAPFLRTGDLGFLHNGQLFVTGRLKDLIIVRGVNHYPDDLEQTAHTAHEACQVSGGAAFSIDDADGERVVLVQELRREFRKADPLAVAEAIRGAIAEHHGLELAAIVLVNPGAVPRTTSGKVQRSACRDLFTADALEPVHVWRAIHRKLAREAPNTSAPFANSCGIVATSLTIDGQLMAYLVDKLASLLGIDPAQVSTTDSLVSYGIASADAVALAGHISDELNVDLPALALWDYPTIATLTGYLIADLGVTAIPVNAEAAAA